MPYSAPSLIRATSRCGKKPCALGATCSAAPKYEQGYCGFLWDPQHRQDFPDRVPRSSYSLMTRNSQADVSARSSYVLGRFHRVGDNSVGEVRFQACKKTYLTRRGKA
jgi:hypothetical protein